jgi:hypothetical protein
MLCRESKHTSFPNAGTLVSVYSIAANISTSGGFSGASSGISSCTDGNATTSCNSTYNHPWMLLNFQTRLANIPSLSVLLGYENYFAFQIEAVDTVQACTY